MMSYDPKGLLQQWGIEFQSERAEIEIPGSPERCLYRTVVEDVRGRRFVLESIPDHKRGLKSDIARTLNGLFERGLKQIVPYAKSDSGNYHVWHAQRWWQLVPHIQGVHLERPDYATDAWRGLVLAAFLIELGQKAKYLKPPSKNHIFSLTVYIDDLLCTMKIHSPQTVPLFDPVFRFLKERFFNAYTRMPIRFCHGDYHPLNIIWGKRTIRAVIDWEFSGFKAEIYDTANLIGCIGMEDPNSLDGDLVRFFIESMQQAGGLSAWSWEYLVEFVMAMRFAWLSEWLRKKDGEMIAMESDYLKILMENRDYLKKVWNI